MLVKGNVDRHPKNHATRVMKQCWIDAFTLYKEMQANVKEGMLSAKENSSAMTHHLADPVHRIA